MSTSENGFNDRQSPTSQLYNSLFSQMDLEWTCAVGGAPYRDHQSVQTAQFGTVRSAVKICPPRHGSTRDLTGLQNGTCEVKHFNEQCRYGYWTYVVPCLS